MADNIVTALFEHNNWANLRVLEACSALTDKQLDEPPQSATKGTIRRTLWHLVEAQQWYLSLLTDAQPYADDHPVPTFPELRESVQSSGDALLTLARDETKNLPKRRVPTDEGLSAEPWVIMLQAINHATEHREQLSSMLTALGVKAPEMDGWAFAAATGAESTVSE